MTKQERIENLRSTLDVITCAISEAEYNGDQDEADHMMAECQEFYNELHALVDGEERQNDC